MSWIVFLIAAAPAVIVALVGCSSTSRIKLYATFLIAACIGIFSGNPAYIGLDIFFSLIGLYVGHTQQTSLIREKRIEPKHQLPQTPEASSLPDNSPKSNALPWWALAAFGVLIYKAFFDSKPAPIPPPTPAPTYKPAHGTNPSPNVNPVTNIAPAPKPSPQPRQRTVDECAVMPKKEDMIRCLETARPSYPTR